MESATGTIDRTRNLLWLYSPDTNLWKYDLGSGLWAWHGNSSSAVGKLSIVAPNRNSFCIYEFFKGWPPTSVRQSMWIDSTGALWMCVGGKER